jgi:hypothetical protein
MQKKTNGVPAQQKGGVTTFLNFELLTKYDLHLLADRLLIQDQAANRQLRTVRPGRNTRPLAWPSAGIDVSPLEALCANASAVQRAC